MDYRALQFWLGVAQMVVNVVIVVWVWQSNRQKATVAQIRAVDNKVRDVETRQAKLCGKHWSRTTALESSVEGLPTHDDLGDMYTELNAVRSSVDKLDGTVSGVAANVNLLVEHHLKGEPK